MFFALNDHGWKDMLREYIRQPGMWYRLTS